MNAWLKIATHGAACGLMLGVVLVVAGRMENVRAAETPAAATPAAVTAVPEVIQAQKLELVNPDGKVVARLSAASGTPAIMLYDANGTNRAQLALDDDGTPALLLSDSKDVTRAQLSVNTADRPNLLMFDDKATCRAALNLDKDDQPGLQLVDKTNTTRGQFRLDDDNTPNFEMYDDKGEMRQGLWLLDNGMPGMAMFDAKGEVRSRYGLTNDTPYLDMNDSKGNALATLLVTEENVPSLAMGNDADHMTMQLCVSPTGFTELEMRDQQDVIRSLMSVDGNGNAVISQSDKTGDPRLYLRMKNEEPGMGITDSNGTYRWSAP